jgi:hypothetical protein
LLYVLKCDLFWRKFHGFLRRMCGHLLQGGILCKCLFSPFALHCQLIMKVSYGFFCLHCLSIGESVVLKLHAIIVLGLTWDFKYSSVSSMNLVWLSVYLLTVVKPSCWMDCSLYQYEVTFLSSNCGLKSTLSHISMATPACFLDYLA